VGPYPLFLDTGVRPVLAADMSETTRLWETINAWWEDIEVFIETGITNAKTEAANTSVKQIKRTGRSHRTTTTKPVSSWPAPTDTVDAHP